MSFKGFHEDQINAYTCRNFCIFKPPCNFSPSHLCHFLGESSTLPTSSQPVPSESRSRLSCSCNCSQEKLHDFLRNPMVLFVSPPPPRGEQGCRKGEPETQAMQRVKRELKGIGSRVWVCSWPCVPFSFSFLKRSSVVTSVHDPRFSIFSPGLSLVTRAH